MKKSVLIIAALAAFSFSSCKKDYKCDCVYSTGGGVEYEIHTTKKKAEAACEEHNASGVTCELGND